MGNFRHVLYACGPSAKIGFQESDWIKLTNQVLPRNWRSFRSFTCGPSYLYTHFHCGPLDVMMMMKAVQIVAVVLLLALSTSEGKKYKEGDCEGELSRSLVGRTIASRPKIRRIATVLASAYHFSSCSPSMRDVPDWPAGADEGEWGGQLGL